MAVGNDPRERHTQYRDLAERVAATLPAEGVALAVLNGPEGSGFTIAIHVHDSESEAIKLLEGILEGGLGILRTHRKQIEDAAKEAAANDGEEVVV